MSEVDLAAEVQEAINGAAISGRVTVEPAPIPGVVRLRGLVVSEEERLKADQAARSVEDVLDVVDEITVGNRRA